MFKSFADLVTYQWLLLPRGSHLAESLNFFIYDVPKIFTLLLCVVFVVSFMRTFLPPERIRQILSHKMEFVGNILAACFGVFIPFCTCSAIPLFIGMLESGVPLGVTMSFLVSSPMINEVALVLLWGLFGWRVAVTYAACGIIIATFSGYLIGRLKMEKYLEPLATKQRTCGSQCSCESEQKAESSKLIVGWGRIRYAYEYTLDVFKSIWLYIILGVGVGALIHGYVPVEFVSKYAGPNNPFAVIFAVLLGIPLYANCAGAIPVVQAILEKGLPLGTSLAFMMAVTGLSLPEFLILRKVMKLRLLLTFFGTVGLGIIFIGYLFNFTLAVPAESKMQSMDLAAATKTGLPIVVEIGADFCPACRAQKPIIEELAKEYKGKIVFLYLDVYQNKKIAQQFQANVIPIIGFYDKKGNVNGRLVGYQEKAAIIGYLKKLKELK